MRRLAVSKRLAVFAVPVLVAIVGCASHPVDEAGTQPPEEPSKRLVHLEASYIELPAKQAFGLLADNLSETALIHRVDAHWADHLIEEARKSGALTSSPAFAATDGQPCALHRGYTESFVVDFEPVNGEWQEVRRDLEAGVRLDLLPTICDDRTIEISARVTVTEFRRPVPTFTTNIGSREGAPATIVTIDLPEQSVRKCRQPILLEDDGRFLVGTRAVPAKDDAAAAGDEKALLILVKAKIVDDASDPAPERSLSSAR